MGDKKTALITGAGGGIGSAVSKRFLREGYRVILVDKDPAALRAKHDDASGNENVTQLVVDLVNEREFQDLRTEVVRLDGGLAAAAFCHGGCFVDGKPFPEVAYWDLNYRQNMIASVNAVQCCAEGLKKGRGNLVILSSVDGILALEGAGPYDAAKASQLSLAKSISRAYAPDVCAIALILGTVYTDAWKVAIEQDPDVLRRRGNENLAGKIMLPEEVAGLVWLLCQEEARIMRGQSVIADNGWSFLAGTFSGLTNENAAPMTGKSGVAIRLREVADRRVLRVGLRSTTTTGHNKTSGGDVQQAAPQLNRSPQDK